MKQQTKNASSKAEVRTNALENQNGSRAKGEAAQAKLGAKAIKKTPTVSYIVA